MEEEIDDQLDLLLQTPLIIDNTNVVHLNIFKGNLTSWLTNINTLKQR